MDARPIPIWATNARGSIESRNPSPTSSPTLVSSVFFASVFVNASASGAIVEGTVGGTTSGAVGGTTGEAITSGAVGATGWATMSGLLAVILVD